MKKINVYISDQMVMLMFYLAVSTSILSFSENNILSNVCGIGMYVSWAGLLICMVFNRQVLIPQNVKAFVVIWAISYILFKVLYFLGIYPSGGSGTASYLIYCAVFYMIGYNINLNHKKMLFKFLIVICISLLVLSITQFLLYDADYVYNQFAKKNQMGQFLGMSIIFNILIMPQLFNKKIVKIIFWCCGLFSLITLFLLHSRTPLISVTVVALYTFLRKQNKKSNDYAKMCGAILIIAVIIYFMGGRSFLSELFNTESYYGLSSDSALNTLSSGRIELFKIALIDFAKNPIFGIGAYGYIDCFVINILRTGGLVSAIMLLPVSYGVMYKSLKIADAFNKSNSMKNNVVFKIIQCVIVYYFIISLYEGYPPLGPGTSTFMLWVFIGMGERYHSFGCNVD